MDLVKLGGRTKIKVGDCVSVPINYFGDEYSMALQVAGFTSDRIYGRVSEVILGNRKFDVKWDVEGDTTTMTLEKVRCEPFDTPLQKIPSSSTITALLFR